MSPDHPTPAPADDPRVVLALELFVAQAEAGRAPDRRAFLASYPEIRQTLAACLDGLAILSQTAHRLLPDSPAAPVDPAQYVKF